MNSSAHLFIRFLLDCYERRGSGGGGSRREVGKLCARRNPSRILSCDTRNATFGVGVFAADETTRARRRRLLSAVMGPMEIDPVRPAAVCGVAAATVNSRHTPPQHLLLLLPPGATRVPSDAHTVLRQLKEQITDLTWSLLPYRPSHPSPTSIPLSRSSRRPCHSMTWPVR